MSMLRNCLLSAASCLLFACASDDEEAIVVAPLPEFEQKREVKQLWSKSVEGVGELHNALTPVVEYGMVYLPSPDGVVVALNKDTGEEVWEVDTELELSGAVAAGNGVIAAGTLNAEVIVLDAKTGKEQWRTLVSSEVISPPAVGENSVVVNTIDGKLYCLDLETGSRRWFYDRNVPVLTLRGTSSAKIARGATVSGFANGKIAAFLLNKGGLIWEKRVAAPSGRSELDRMIDIDADPVVFGEYVYAASYNGNVVALKLRNGEVAWQRELSTFQNISVDAEAMFASDHISHLKAMDRRNGSTIWTQSSLENRQLTGPAVFNDVLVVGDFEGYLHFIDKTNGAFIARTHVDDEGFMVEPVVNGDKLYALSRDGTLSVFKLN